MFQSHKDTRRGKDTRKITAKERRARQYQQKQSEARPIDERDLYGIIQGGLSKKTTLAICLLLVAGTCMYAYMQAQEEADRRRALIPFPDAGRPAASSMPARSAYAFYKGKELWVPKWYKDALKTVNETCQNLKETTGLRAFNNVPYYKVEKSDDATVIHWTGNAKRTEKRLNLVFKEVRKITKQLIDQRIAQFNSVFEARRQEMALDLNRQLKTGNFSPEYHEKALEILIGPIYTYNRLIAMLIDLHVHEAVIKSMKGGLSREFARLSALTILRALEATNPPVMPFINITTLSLAHGEESPHAIVSIRQEKPSDFPEAETSFCDAWLYRSQGHPFFTGITEHPFMAVEDMAITHEIEIGRAPNMENAPDSIASFFGTWRKYFIHQPFTIPAEEARRLNVLSSVLQATMNASDTQFEQDESYMRVEDFRPG